MSSELHHECTRVPVTALLSCGPLLVAAEGPFLRFYECQDFAHLSSQRVFQAQAIHGISTIRESADHAILLIWGGCLLRVLELDLTGNLIEIASLKVLQLSEVVRTPDWILHLCPSPDNSENASSAQEEAWVCAAVTAHNALLELTIKHRKSDRAIENRPAVSIHELTASSRSILYSAHLAWDSPNRILIAAGTAFGEIIYWSWDRRLEARGKSLTHYVFLGHEGSIFGVQISDELDVAPDRSSRRLLASCSDDRTIRVWDISGISTTAGMCARHEDNEEQRTRHTGFSNASFDSISTTSDCLAIGWGHMSRVWTVRFLDSNPSSEAIVLLSSGEDATSRTWQLPASSHEDTKDAGPLTHKLVQLDKATCHSGKNIWSVIVVKNSSGSTRIVMGGADSKIAACALGYPHPLLSSSRALISEYTVNDIASMVQVLPDERHYTQLVASHKSSKMTEFFRSYSFLSSSSFLLTTNCGKVYQEVMLPADGSRAQSLISQSRIIDELQTLAGYSTCTAIPSLGLGFIAGSRGEIYTCGQSVLGLTRLYTVCGKVGDIFAAERPSSSEAREMILLITLVGQNVAQLLHLRLSQDKVPEVVRSVTIPISDLLTGLSITSMKYISTTSNEEYLLLGFRRGSIAAYRDPTDEIGGDGSSQASLFRIIERVHDKETVTCMSWIASSSGVGSGHLISIGRDGCLAIHAIDLAANSIHLVHNLTLPIGPNIEGIHLNEGHLRVYGFTSKKFVVYDTITEEETMSVETGGAHRSWTFWPSSHSQGGGILVWTRASSMHICHQEGANHQVIRSGGHGREIKAVAISPPLTSRLHTQLIATGAEDTDIKIFEYKNGDLVCRKTLQKHTTGIQHLQWSDDGAYLFSSGGCEEFYIWRVRPLPAELGGIGVVCESVYKPESEHSDLRIMSFDVWKRGTSFVIAVVFSDSNMKVYSYDSMAAEKWKTLARGVYFTSCLTQCTFISPTAILTAGTDGHAVLWPLGPSLQQPHSTVTAPAETLSWKQPARIHQNSSKTLATHKLKSQTTLIVSGGDDGSISFLLASTFIAGVAYDYPPIIVTRAHASAVTACAVVTHDSRIFVLTSGNDQWARLWEVIPSLTRAADGRVATTEENSHPLEIRRDRKIKTNVADVSSMAVLGKISERAARILICGVGMEVIRIDWEGYSTS